MSAPSEASAATEAAYARYDRAWRRERACGRWRLLERARRRAATAVERARWVRALDVESALRAREKGISATLPLRVR